MKNVVSATGLFFVGVSFKSPDGNILRWFNFLKSQTTGWLRVQDSGFILE